MKFFQKENFPVAFFIYLIILCPAFFGYFTLNKGQMIYLAVIFFCTLIFFLFDVSNLLRSFSRNHTYFILGFLLLCCEYFASSVLNIRRNSYSFGDFIEVLRPVVYLFTYLTSLVIIIPTLRKKGICFVFNIFEKAVFFFSLIEFLKFFKPHGMPYPRHSWEVAFMVSVKFYWQASAAVMMAMEYTSMALQPLDRSLMGAFKPKRMGP